MKHFGRNVRQFRTYLVIKLYLLSQLITCLDLHSQTAPEEERRRGGEEERRRGGEEERRRGGEEERRRGGEEEKKRGGEEERRRGALLVQ